ncbi:MAG: glycosyltransferase family 4 protein [Salinibacter sp.]|uniref:glycosyltransferase family 4 protein n=1 Tax=Salinibacter sp. TaxID=2065818 RepID=UPI0035D4810D
METQSHTPERTDDRTRVLQVVDKFSIDGESIHGIARLMSWWVNVLDRERFEMNILGLKAPSKAGRYIERQGGQVFYSDYGRLNPASILDIAKVVRQTRADLLHLHGYKACTLGRVVGALLGMPVVLHEHAVFPTVPPYQKLADWLLAPLNDRVVVNCEAVAEFCVERRSVDPENIEVIFNGVPLDEFRDVPDSAAQEAADELGIDSGAPVVGTVARLEEQKGITHLLNAVPAIKAKVPEMKILIVGDGTLRGELEDEARQLGVADDVIFTGERRDVARLYKLMDVKVISSVYEGTTLTVFEAMATGTPVVATTVDGVEEVIEDGRTGVLVPPKEPAPIADAVTDLLGNPDRAQRLSERAEEAVKEYDVRTSMRRIENLYETLLSERQEYDSAMEGVVEPKSDNQRRSGKR